MVEQHLENLNMDKITGFLFGYIRANIETIEYIMENFPPDEAVKHSKKFLKHIDETFDLNVHLKDEMAEMGSIEILSQVKKSEVSDKKKKK